MAVVAIMLPIIVMMAMGYIFQRTRFISEEGMNGIKTYLTKIALPMTIFNAMANAELSGDTALIIIVMFSMLSVAMVIGFLLRPFIGEPYKKYVPFLITVFEGGMLSYPLYENLCGADRLVNIVVIDIAGCIFGFGIFYGILSIVENGSGLNLKVMGKVAFTSPTFDAVVLGLLFNMTGIMRMIMDSEASECYTVVKNIVVAPLTAMILLYIGYSMKFEKKLLSVCIKTIVLRCVVMTGLAFAVIFLLRGTINDKYMLAAYIIMFITSPTFSLPGFVNDKRAAEYFAMTTSMFVILTVVGYAIVSVVLFS